LFRPRPPDDERPRPLLLRLLEELRLLLDPRERFRLWLLDFEL
jgi:hypothetical protein